MQTLTVTGTSRALQWLLNSGIQEPSGGVARYYLASEGRYAPVSTEITGYAAGAYAYLGNRDAALHTARFLTREAWNKNLDTFPFELGPGSPAYFFDCGIIVRGLLAVWRLTGEEELLQVANNCGRSMARDFLTGSAIHPVVSLPDRKPWPYEKRWSREPGCFQLKAAMAWRDLWKVTGEEAFHTWWERALEMGLANDTTFLAGAAEPEKVMDRLHAYCYYLEGLLGEPRCATALRAGVERVAGYLREIAPVVARSDVYAQILRVRLLGARLGACPLDERAAREEASALPSYQHESFDRRLDGGFSFGRRNGMLLPFVNPVSTAFCAQALDWWAGEPVPALESLI